MNSTTQSLPAGITGFDRMPYGYRRWNGSVWANIQVDSYNASLSNIERRHKAGFNVQHLIDGLYNLAYSFDSCATTFKYSEA